jgi:hypothetical protein
MRTMSKTNVAFAALVGLAAIGASLPVAAQEWHRH